MKKISIFVLAALAMISCGNTYTAQKVSLTNQNDSINYALGLVNGAQLKNYQLRNDSSEESITEFIDALQRGYDGKVEELSEVSSIAKNIGQAIKASEAKGLADNEAWTLNEKIFFQGLINGIHADTTMMQSDEARQLFQSAYQASRNEETKAGKAITAKCPSKAKTIELKSYNDSLNYAFGVMNGSEIRLYVLANDTTGEQTKEFISMLNKSLKSKVHNPQLVAMGENIGKSIKDQEPEGLIGEPSLTTDFELIKQGFINGLKKFYEQMNDEEAGIYIQSTMDNIKYGSKKAEGEAFLAENALREGVVVTESGLQYEVLKQGRGPKPAATDKVRVNYTGKLIDGTVFDSCELEEFGHKQPFEFSLTGGVIDGWLEGVALMNVGSKYRLYIPYNLGYGERGAGQKIAPYSTLIFDVELLGIVK